MSKSVIEIVPALPEHAALPLRAADREEVWAVAHLQPQAALRESIASSAAAWTGMADGEPVCVFGVVPASILGGIGIPWMLGSDGVVKHQRAFLRRNKRYVEAMLEMYPLLINFVDARNTIAIRWLRWLGFEIREAKPYGVEGLPFHQFDRRA